MERETVIDRALRMKLHGSGVEAAISEIASAQHGVIARRQLIGLGVGTDVIQRRLSAGRLIALHRGVYVVGHTALPPRARLMAAALSVGPDAVVSHQSAAALWGLRPTSRKEIEITAPRLLRKRPNLGLHHRRLSPDEVTARYGIPTTTVPRTLFDLAAILARADLESAITQADFHRRRDPLSLPLLLERYPGHRGNAHLRAVLKSKSLGKGLPKSELERRFLRLIRRHRIPHPAVNAYVEIAGRLVERDCVWGEQRLNVELDGRQGHSTDDRFERDRADDRAMVAAGWRVIRVTWRQLTDESASLVRDVRNLLGGPA